MVEIRRSTVLEAPIEEVWAILRDFNGHESWHPSVGASRLEDGASGDMIGIISEDLDNADMLAPRCDMRLSDQE